MKKKMMFHWVLSFTLAGLFITSGAVGQTTDNYAEDFESYDLGAFIVEESAYWAGATNAGVIVATNFTANYVGGVFPLQYDRENNQALWYEEFLTNTVPAGTASLTNWVDMVLKPTFSDDDEAPELPPEGAIAGVYFSSNGTLVVSHTPSNAVTPVVWVEIPEVQVGEDDWIRLTIAANLKDGGSPFGGVGNTRFYQIYINGVVVTNEVAFQTPSRASGGGGSWFGAPAGSGKTTLSGTVFRGTGYLDDVVVKNQSVFTQVPITDIDWPELEDAGPFVYGDITLGQLVLVGGQARDDEENPIPGEFSFVNSNHGMYLPAGTNTLGLRFDPDDTAAFFPASGGSVQVEVTQLPMTITASNIVKEVGVEYVFTGNEYSVDITLVGSDAITEVVLSSDGAAEEATVGDYDIVIDSVDGVGLANYDITLVAGTMTVEAAVDPGTGPSQAWLDAFGWDEEDLDVDRGDGMTRREAWLASVDPTNTNDVFRVQHIWSENGTNYIEWVSHYVDETLPPFAIWARTNLMDEGYSVRGTHPRTAGDPISAAVTNVWWEDAPAYPVFYRIAGTNTVVVID